MKKSISITLAVLGTVFFSSMIRIDKSDWPPWYNGIVSKPISSGIMRIAERSCVKCHTEDGDKKAMRRLNLSDWNKLLPEKQINKAKGMYKMVSEGKMPPEGFLEKNPDAVLTKDEVKIIYDWATTNKAVKIRHNNFP